MDWSRVLLSPLESSCYFGPRAFSHPPKLAGKHLLRLLTAGIWRRYSIHLDDADNDDDDDNDDHNHDDEHDDGDDDDDDHHHHHHHDGDDEASLLHPHDSHRCLQKFSPCTTNDHMLACREHNATGRQGLPVASPSNSDSTARCFLDSL